MFELQKQNERALESVLDDKRKKMKDLDRALREVDMEVNQAQVRRYPAANYRRTQVNDCATEAEDCPRYVFERVDESQGQAGFG